MAIPAHTQQPPPSSSRTGGISQGSGFSARPRTVRRGIDLHNIWRQARKTLKGQFLTLASTLFILSLVAGLLITQGLRQGSQDLDTIANGSVPSIDAAQAMSQYLEDIDAKAADYLAAASLTEQTPCSIIGSTRTPGNLTDHDCDQLNIDAELILANKQLYITIHNVTYPGERTALQRITAGLEEYSNDIAIEEHEYRLAVSKTDPHDEHLQKAHLAYIAATNVLNVRITKPPTLDASNRPVYDEAVLPNCTIEGKTIAAKDWPLGSLQENIDCLSSINKGYLDASYTDTVNFLGITTALLGLLCLVLCGLLVFVLLRMILLTHRLVNPGLTLASLTALALSFVVLTNFIGMSGRHGAFGLMVKDAYESVYDSTLLKRYATAANADESRWLIAVDFGDQAEMDRWQQDWDANRTHVNALIAQAVGNPTWPEEDQPLANMQSHWKSYTNIDPQIRAIAMKTANPHRIHDAEALSTGKSNDNFSAFTEAVDRLGQANRGYYTRTYTLTNAAVLRSILLSNTLFPLIGLLAVWGIAHRLKDF